MVQFGTHFPRHGHGFLNHEYQQKGILSISLWSMEQTLQISVQLQCEGSSLQDVTNINVAE